MSEAKTLPYAPDLTKHAPRSARCRLGGYAILPRMLDKCRASLAGTNGEYHYNCPLDQLFLSYVGIDAEALRTEVAKGLGDGEILAWINANAQHKRAPWEIEQWTAYIDRRQPDSNSPSAAFFQELLKSLGPQRGDIHTWADLLDLDDYCSFGGKA